MQKLFLLLALPLLFSCGEKPKEKKTTPKTDTVKVNTPPVANKDYLKKRPEEFNEFLMLTDVVAFKGRVATKKDVNSKEAVFNMDSKKDPSHRALNINIPFYAFLKQSDNKPPKFVAIMQAETLSGDTILGYKAANGLYGICRPDELEYFESQKGRVYKTIQ